MLKGILRVLFVLGVCFGTASPAAFAGGPAPESLRGTIRDHIKHQEMLQGAFAVVDERTGELRQLELIRVHERVGKTGDYYYSCTDMRDVKTGDELDLDFDIESTDGNLDVVAIRIHKDNGKARYTYDEFDNMISLG